MDENNEVVIVTNVFGDICIRKARRKRQKLLVKELMYDYANNTTLHGLPYVTKTGLTLIEKIFWLVTFIASVSICLFFMSGVWVKWQTSPVIVTASEQLVPVNKVPFPSVTICPQSKCKATVYNFTNEKIIIDAFMENIYTNGTINDTMRERIAKFDGISGICDFPHFHDLTEIYPNGYTDSSVVEHIMEVAPNFTDVFAWCRVHNQDLDNCDSLFDKVLTSEGICFNMNSLEAEEIFRTRILQNKYQYLYTRKRRRGWSVELGYNEAINTSEDPDSDFYPAPGAENGEAPDVEVVLKHSVRDRDQLCNGLNTGFRVYIQHPTELPQSSLYYYAVINNQVSSMALSFSIFNTIESLRRYAPDIRQCYFPDERYLKYFSLYTASNCNIECLSNITDEHCGCVQFYMPHTDASSKRICTEQKTECISRARRIMLRQELSKDSFKCQCLPACNSVDYDAEILKTDYNLKHLIKTYQKATNATDERFKGIKFSKLEMYFKRSRFMSWRRSEMFGLIEFLSYCGGLLGLFLGFSFLSLVEIFYFLSLRLCCTLKKDLEEEKGQNEPEKEIRIDKY